MQDWVAGSTTEKHRNQEDKGLGKCWQTTVKSDPSTIFV